MATLKQDGQKTIADLASRHGVSGDAVAHLLAALNAGGGRQAQFNHPELGGMGQWSQGGMIMIGDMFNQGLKARVAALCSELAEAVQGAGLPDTQAGVPDSGSNRQRWPATLGSPASSGSQNDMHYAIFPEKRRLAIEQDGYVTLYDTGDHRIGGVSQQQSGDQSLRFTSQHGPVALSDLPIVTTEPQEQDHPAAPKAEHSEARPIQADGAAPAAPAPSAASAGAQGDDIFARLERLAELHSRKIITPEEFAAKKAELLARI